MKLTTKNTKSTKEGRAKWLSASNLKPFISVFIRGFF